MGNGTCVLRVFMSFALTLEHLYLKAVTIPLTIAGFAGGVAFFGNLEMDPTKPIFVCIPLM